jgi:AcrR family transcriptional regulator
VPKISAPTVAENREFRRDALLAAAAELMQRGGSFTVAEVAREVGLSRSAVYEYYRSAAELIADVLIDEFSAWSSALAAAAAPDETPTERVHSWIDGVLTYVKDGRHALLRAAGSIELPEDRREQLHRLHESLISPLVDALTAMGATDPVRDARYVWGIVEVAIDRIESGESAADDESVALLAFVDAALRGTIERTATP